MWIIFKNSVPTSKKTNTSIIKINNCQTKILYEFLIAPIRATCPAHIIFLNFITLKFFVAYVTPRPRSFATFFNTLDFYGDELLPTRPTPQAWRPPLVGCSRLLITYNRSYLPYLEAIFSIHSLKDRSHSGAVQDPLTLSVNAWMRMVFRNWLPNTHWMHSIVHALQFADQTTG
jgi:hypothetical protein